MNEIPPLDLKSAATPAERSRGGFTMDLLSQIFTRRELAVRRALFLPLTSMMLLTAFSGKESGLGWWGPAAQAPKVSYSPEVIHPEDRVVTVSLQTQSPLSRLEVSLDAGADWLPLELLPGLERTLEEDGTKVEFKFSLQSGYLAEALSHKAAKGHALRSVLIRGVTQQGQKTAPRVIAFLYAPGS